MTSDPGAATAAICPSCESPVANGDDFCEACGTQLTATAQAAPAEPVARTATPKVCHVCGGEVTADGFCGSCGTKARTERDHWSESPSAALAAVCDRGIAHARNEDAMAMGVSDDGSVSVMVVCDGVTSAPDSDRASLSASKAARDVLLDGVDGAPGGGAAAIEHWSKAITAATAEANHAAVAIARSLGDPPEPPSSTFVTAVAAGSLVVVGWCGDSRAYWLPDDGEPVMLTVDHSLGSEMIRSGMTREEAEAQADCHTITRWLGADSPTPISEITTVEMTAAGWLVLCSDGLWNYVSQPDDLRTMIADHADADNATPLTIADALVAYANEQGGHDNITAALLRHT